jgi:hypothetical protein
LGNDYFNKKGKRDSIMDAKFMDRFTEQGRVVAMMIVKGIIANGGKARIGVTWMDMGQRWAWETVLVHSQSLKTDYQLLDPKDFHDMNEGKITPERIEQLIQKAR